MRALHTSMQDARRGPGAARVASSGRRRVPTYAAYAMGLRRSSRADARQEAAPRAKLRMFLDSANTTQWTLWFNTGLFYGVFVGGGGGGARW